MCTMLGLLSPARTVSIVLRSATLAAKSDEQCFISLSFTLFPPLPMQLKEQLLLSE